MVIFYDTEVPIYGGSQVSRQFYRTSATLRACIAGQVLQYLYTPWGVYRDGVLLLRMNLLYLLPSICIIIC